ncbi:substrate-binding domain-containing protein [Intestinibacillus massiliensis]|nr:substrate-binding domain-containing protein [Intestinibacillus massiliensis]
MIPNGYQGMAFLSLPEQGIKVPGQLRLTGFHNDQPSSLPQINLTTIARPAGQIGALAAKMILMSARRKCCFIRNG